MQCNYEIDIKEPDTSEMLFPPHVRFRLVQLNMTPDCVSDDEIDYQINALINHAEKMRKEVKKKLKAAKTRHDKILAEKQEKF